MPVGEAADLDRVLGVTRELVELVRGSGLARLSVHAGLVRWEIEGVAAATATAAVPVGAPAGSNGAAPHAVLNGSPLPGAGEPAQSPADPPGHAVLAPLVGVFYRSPAPGAAPFVEVGQPVAAGQQVAVVEAMKMMNEVVADQGGVVREVHAAEAEIVEFGQRLFTIEPA